MRYLNVNNYKWADGHGAFASGLATGAGLYKIGSYLGTRKQRLAQRQSQLVKPRIQRKKTAISTRERFLSKIISKPEIRQRLRDLGYNSRFLTTGDLDLPRTNFPSTTPSSYPFSSISVSNWNNKQFRIPKCAECLQMAEASYTPTPYYENTSLENRLGKTHNLMLLSALGFVAGAGFYLMVVRKLRTLDWYKKNFSKQSLLEYYDERLNTLENDQKQILETQKKILELLTKNKP